MITKLEEVARPYARAAFEFASEQQQLPQWLTMFQVLLAISSDAKIQAFLLSPRGDALSKPKLLFNLAGDLFDAFCRVVHRK